MDELISNQHQLLQRSSAFASSDNKDVINYLVPRVIAGI